MLSLLKEMQALKPRLQKAGHVLLLSDYDGTLTPIVSSPDTAVLPEDIRDSLWKLSQNPRTTVGVISGRALSDLKGLVGLENIIYAGNHGIEIEGHDVKVVNPTAERARPFMQALALELGRVLGAEPGVLVENKGLTISIHYRKAEAEKARIAETLRRALAGALETGRIRLTSGKKIFEVRPAGAWDKGEAVEFILKRFLGKSAAADNLTIYLGDDVTDEDAFRAVKRYSNGITVFVGGDNKSIQASYFLESTREVGKFLNMLLQYL